MSWFSTIFTRRRHYRDLSVTIAEHLEERTEELMDEGMPRDEAEHTARREFGNVALLEERSRAEWQWPRLESLWADVRLAARQLLRSPGISFITVLTLALGIGANTAVFTLTWNIVLAGLPVPHPEQLVQYTMTKGNSVIGLSWPEYTILRQRQNTSSDLLAWNSDEEPVRQGSYTHSEKIQLLTGNAFRVLGIQPAMGRFFDEAEDEAQGAKGVPAILSYEAWQSRFHGEASALGQSLNVKGHPVTIVGVMPRGFEGLTANLHPMLYLPMSFEVLEEGEKDATNAGQLDRYVMGRLLPGKTLRDARAELQAITPTVRKEADPTGIFLGQFFKDFRLVVEPGRSGVSWVKMVYERPLLVLELLMVLVLALCCVNTTLVMLARVSGRQSEYVVRVALGAGKMRLVRQVLIETTLLVVPGLLGGVFAGWLGAHALVAMLGDRGTPSQMDLRPNAVILAVNTAAAILVALGAGLWPALHAAGTNPAKGMKAQSRSLSSKHLGGWAISLQIAVSITLVAAAALLGGTLVHLMTENNGLRVQNAVIADLNLNDLKLKSNQRVALTSRVLQRVQSTPGVEAAGYISAYPMTGYFSATRMFSVDRNQIIHSKPSLFLLQATAGYFDAAGTRILTGKVSANEAGAINNCVLSESLAHALFPDQSAVGELVYHSKMGLPDGADMDPQRACRVTAVVEDAKFVSLRSPAPEMLYDIENAGVERKFYDPSGILVVRGKNTTVAADAVKEAAREMMPQGTTTSVQTLGQLMDQDLSRERMLVSLSGIFAVLALLLTALGLYGLLMRSVTLRTRELGIRMALGAGRGSILASLSRRVLIEVAIGVAGGLALAWMTEGVVRRLLTEPQSGSAVGIAVSGGVVLLIAVLAAAVPAIRAARIDPMEALRAE
ncbi:MAG TPA: ABC transporter permease [Terracidiphilus sp.]|nr:ABC transporter permease [Terracidiphilus sp.]